MAGNYNVYTRPPPPSVQPGGGLIHSDDFSTNDRDVQSTFVNFGGSLLPLPYMVRQSRFFPDSYEQRTGKQTLLNLSVTLRSTTVSY